MNEALIHARLGLKVLFEMAWLRYTVAIGWTVATILLAVDLLPPLSLFAAIPLIIAGFVYGTRHMDQAWYSDNPYVLPDGGLPRVMGYGDWATYYIYVGDTVYAAVETTPDVDGETLWIRTVNSEVPVAMADVWDVVAVDA